MEIIVSQNENQNISIENNNLQNLTINQNENQDINITNETPQELLINQNRNQVILVGDGGAVSITDVLVNGVSVVSGNIAYVIVPTKTSELTNDSGFITNETDPTVPSYVKEISLADINNWNNKQNELISGSNIKTINNTSILGSGNIEITGNVYTAGVGININSSNVISNEITSYNDLTDLPTIPTNVSQLNNDLDFVSDNELSQVAFSGSYVDLSNTPNIPAFTSDLTNDSGFIDKNVNDLTYYTLSSNLATVATSGSYNDLSNTPTIPTVNDGTLTIQKNSTTIDTFTANSANNKTINITVPTATSDLTNDSGFITVDTGSNANGSYIKYSDGTMICNKEYTIASASFPNTWGGWYETAQINLGSFPVNFIATPYVYVTAIGGSFFIEGVKSTSQSSVGTTYLLKPSSSSISNIAIEILAIGKWK